MSDHINHQRRRFFGTAAMTLATAEFTAAGASKNQDFIKLAGATKGDLIQARSIDPQAIKPGAHTAFAPLKQIDAGVLNIGYAEVGPADGPVVLLLHGWPYDIHSFVDVAPILASAGYRVIIPYLRGYGTTRFLSRIHPQRSAIGTRGRHDRADGRTQHREGDRRRLRLGRAHRQHHGGAVAGTLQGNGLGKRLSDRQPAGRQEAAAAEGRAVLVVSVLLRDRARPARLRANTREFAKLIWQMASPTWKFDDATFERALRPSTIRTMLRSSSTIIAGGLVLADGEAKYDDLKQSSLKVRSSACRPSRWRAMPMARRIRSRQPMPRSSPGNTSIGLSTGGIGHNLPQEAPQAFAEAVLDVDAEADRRPAGRRTTSQVRRFGFLPINEADRMTTSTPLLPSAPSTPADATLTHGLRATRRSMAGGVAYRYRMGLASWPGLMLGAPFRAGATHVV